MRPGRGFTSSTLLFARLNARTTHPPQLQRMPCQAYLPTTLRQRSLGHSKRPSSWPRSSSGRIQDRGSTKTCAQALGRPAEAPWRGLLGSAALPSESLEGVLRPSSPRGGLCATKYVEIARLRRHLRHLTSRAGAPPVTLLPASVAWTSSSKRIASGGRPIARLASTSR